VRIPDALIKVAVGRCPQSGAPLASQSRISRLENAPRKTEAARLTAALVDQFGTTIKPGAQEILDINDTFGAAHGTQQLAFWNAHHDERGFAPMHIYHAASGTPVVTNLRSARTHKGTEVRLGRGSARIAFEARATAAAFASASVRQAATCSFGWWFAFAPRSTR
jgi:hypothetical protein